MSSGFPKLDRPPIDEVVCGFLFEPLPIGPLEFGVYWEARRGEYPKREVHPAIFGGGSIHLGAPPLRAWLIGRDDELLLQLQGDRFYMNWRKRSGHYPRFSDHEGKEGLLSLALREFAKFSDFCSERSAKRPTPVRLELTKIDVLKKGEDFEDLADLKKLLPVAQVFDHVAASPSMQLQLRLVEQHEADQLHVSVTVTEDAAQLETRHVFQPGSDVEGAFVRANDRVNKVFFGLLNQAEMGRFCIQGEA